MNILDICIILVVLLGAYSGYKKGAIKGLVQTAGLIAIVIVAYQFKGLLGNLLVKVMPFFNFSGGLYSLSALMYHGIAFFVIFILLYCILNILLNLSGFIDFLSQTSVMYELPSKIAGAIIGAIESIIFVFAFSFTVLQVGPVQHNVMESTIARRVVERTPIVNVVFSPSIAAAERIYDHVKNYEVPENVDDETLRNVILEGNLSIIRELIGFQIVPASAIQETITSGKMGIDRNTIVASA